MNNRYFFSSVAIFYLLVIVPVTWASERQNNPKYDGKIDNRGVQRFTIPTLATLKAAQNSAISSEDSSEEVTHKPQGSDDSGPKWSYKPGTLSESEAGSASEDSSEPKEPSDKPISPREKREEKAKLSKQVSTKQIKSKTGALAIPASRHKRHIRQSSIRIADSPSGSGSLETVSGSPSRKPQDSPPARHKRK